MQEDEDYQSLNEGLANAFSGSDREALDQGDAVLLGAQIIAISKSRLMGWRRTLFSQRMKQAERGLRIPRDL